MAETPNTPANPNASAEQQRQQQDRAAVGAMTRQPQRAQADIDRQRTAARTATPTTGESGPNVVQGNGYNTSRRILERNEKMAQQAEADRAERRRAEDERRQEQARR